LHVVYDTSLSVASIQQMAERPRRWKKLYEKPIKDIRVYTRLMSDTDDESIDLIYHKVKNKEDFKQDLVSLWQDEDILKLLFNVEKLEKIEFDYVLSAVTARRHAWKCGRNLNMFLKEAKKYGIKVNRQIEKNEIEKKVQGRKKKDEEILIDLEKFASLGKSELFQKKGNYLRPLVARNSYMWKPVKKYCELINTFNEMTLDLKLGIKTMLDCGSTNKMRKILSHMKNLSETANLKEILYSNKKNPIVDYLEKCLKGIGTKEHEEWKNLAKEIMIILLMDTENFKQKLQGPNKITKKEAEDIFFSLTVNDILKGLEKIFTLKTERKRIEENSKKMQKTFMKFESRGILQELTSNWKDVLDAVQPCPCTDVEHFINRIFA